MPVYIFASAQYSVKNNLTFVNMLAECLEYPTLKDLERFFEEREQRKIDGRVIIMGFTKLTKKEYNILNQQ